MYRLKPIGLLLFPCLGLQIRLFEKVQTTEVATRQTKSACADYDSNSLLNAGFVCVAPPFRVRATNVPAPTTEVATRQTKSTCADYDSNSLLNAGFVCVAPPFRVRATNVQAATVKTCPADVETLTALLIRDLPSYANRVIQQSRSISRTVGGLTQVIIAGRPEFVPLPLNKSEYSSFTPAAQPAQPQQVFLTTLERQYVGGKAAQSQHFHWLFLTQTPDGWRLAMMFSRFGSSEKGSPPTPPQESSNGIIGQAVSTWLRDCRAGAIRPLRK